MSIEEIVEKMENIVRRLEMESSLLNEIRKKYGSSGKELFIGRYGKRFNDINRKISVLTSILNEIFMKKWYDNYEFRFLETHRVKVSNLLSEAVELSLVSEEEAKEIAKFLGFSWSRELALSNDGSVNEKLTKWL